MTALCELCIHSTEYGPDTICTRVKADGPRVVFETSNTAHGHCGPERKFFEAKVQESAR